jgi:hypothetical protein
MTEVLTEAHDQARSLQARNVVLSQLEHSLANCRQSMTADTPLGETYCATIKAPAKLTSSAPYHDTGHSMSAKENIALLREAHLARGAAKDILSGNQDPSQSSRLNDLESRLATLKDRFDDLGGNRA